jgi:hypothetical protein
MGVLWLLHRRAVLAAGIALAVGLALAVGIVIATAAASKGNSGHHPDAVATSPTVKARPSSTTPVPPARTYTPSTVEPAQTALQRSIDGQLARAESSSSIAAAEVLVVPAGEDSAAYPAVPAAARQSPTVYASSFAAELLNRNYRRQSRAELLTWAQAEEALNLLPGVPSSIANKTLYASLADPGIAGATGASPVPSPAAWAAAARTGTTQRVTDLLVAVDPSWAEIIDRGWEPRDPLMTIMDVTGVLIVSTGKTTARRPVSMVLALGSCDRAPGLGAMAVQDWTVR